jgi:hypothetical protein
MSFKELKSKSSCSLVNSVKRGVLDLRTAVKSARRFRSNDECLKCRA